MRVSDAVVVNPALLAIQLKSVPVVLREKIFSPQLAGYWKLGGTSLMSQLAVTGLVSQPFVPVVA